MTNPIVSPQQEQQLQGFSNPAPRDEAARPRKSYDSLERTPGDNVLYYRHHHPGRYNNDGSEFTWRSEPVPPTPAAVQGALVAASVRSYPSESSRQDKRSRHGSSEPTTPKPSKTQKVTDFLGQTFRGNSHRR